MEPDLLAYLDWLRGHGIPFSVRDPLARDPDFAGELVSGEEKVRLLVLEDGEGQMPPVVEHRSPEKGLTADHATQSVARELVRGGHVEPMIPLWEVGAGTGVLASLGALLGAMPVYGTDLDPEAIPLARRTSSDTGVEVEWLEGNLLEPIPDHEEPGLVIANLPHKPRTDRRLLPFSQDGGPEGDAVFAAFAAQAERRLVPGNRILFFLHSLPHPRLLGRMAEGFDLTLLSWKRRRLGEGEFGPLREWFRGRAREGVAWLGSDGAGEYLLCGVWAGVGRPGGRRGGGGGGGGAGGGGAAGGAGGARVVVGASGGRGTLSPGWQGPGLPMARILVIDDDALFRDMMRTVLASAGHAVEEAEDGIKGVEKFRAGKYDLVVVDMYMPGQDGIDTIFEMDAKARGAKVLAVTGGHAMGAQTLRLAESAGADLAMEKRFTPEELLKVVAGLVGG